MRTTNETMNIITDLTVSARSAWKRGVAMYAMELLHEYRNEYGQKLDMPYAELCEALRNGASSWVQYSEGGCSFICDCDIAERLCTPSELKRNHNGDRNPNSRETWLQCQARALGQAAYLIHRIAKEA